MTPKRVLVLGSGGREHALAWRLARDPDAPEVLVAPGTPALATRFPCLALDPLDASAVIAACREHSIDFVVIGPEAPLAAGLADALAEAGILAFGPSRAAAQLESSKWFAKEVMNEAKVPTARAIRVETLGEARRALDDFGPPWVIKADGLAAGKGVLVTRDAEEARAFLEAAQEGRSFGDSGRVVVIEEFLAGEEASVMAVCDGQGFVLLPAARDFKRAFDGDLGPNTGGMGARAPHPRVTPAIEQQVGERVVAPVLAVMRARGTPFRGVLYCGLMLGAKGLRVIEFNARFGDPETEVVLPLVGGSLGALLASAARGALDPSAITRERGAAVAVAVADVRYPEVPLARGMVTGLEACEAREGVTVLFAACAPEGAPGDAGSGFRVTGGRAAYVMAMGKDAAEAAGRARSAVATLGGQGWRFRSDIAADPQAPPDAAAGSAAPEFEPAGNGG